VPLSTTQLRLTGALVALILLVVGVSGWLAERSLRQRELAELGRSLAERAGLVRELAAGTPFTQARTSELDALADRAGRVAQARVTLIAPDGRVLGDSDVSLERIAEVESHAERPEVREALRGGVGQDARRSETVGQELLYLALPLEAGGGVVRLAVPLSEIEAAQAGLRRDLLVAGLVGLAAALALSYLLTRIALRPLAVVRRVVASIAGGDLEPRLPLRWRSELGEISSAINRMAEQLRERLDAATREQERLRAVLNGMVEGVLVVDTAGEIVLANDRLREFYSAWSELHGRRPLEAIRDVELDELLSEAQASREPVFRELRVGRGTERILRVHAVGFPAPAAPRLGTVAVFHEVTELARLEQVRQDFVANASHELRTPLAAIRGFAETLLGSQDLPEADRRSYLEIIDRHARRLTLLVNDLLELSQIERRDAHFEPSEVDVARLAETLIQDSAPRFREKRLEVERTGSGPATAWADPRAVEQILQNLLDNAVKYTDAGGRIAVHVQAEGERLRVRVSDSGIGIPQRDLARIFERFYRVDAARSRALGGTGLGLSIVKHLVQRMGGEISVSSEPGRGSTFSFSLPRPPGKTRD
jgi:two-component system phosphate regulon sensor histidine kinase PhoR